MSLALETREVSYHRSGRMLVQRCSLYADRGELLVCGGRAGSGVDTLLRLLAGTLEPDVGRVLVDGVGARPGAAPGRADPRALAVGPDAAARLLAHPGDASILLLERAIDGCPLDRSHDILDAARRRADAGAAVVLTTDELGLAAAYAHVIALLATGRLVAWGPPDVVLSPALRVLDRVTAGGLT